MKITLTMTIQLLHQKSTKTVTPVKNDVPAHQMHEKETAELAQQSSKTRSGRSIKKPARLGFETVG
jgi:hypothetical protein